MLAAVVMIRARIALLEVKGERAIYRHQQMWMEQ